MSDALFELVDFEPEPVYSGRMPLRFTTDYFTPDEIDDANAFISSEKRRRHDEEWWKLYPHVWHRGIVGESWVTENGHSLDTFSVDLRCECGRELLVSERVPCCCPGDLMHMRVCAVCRWSAVGDEGVTAALWNDHAYPGWRDLPAVPLSVRMEELARSDYGHKRTVKWVDANYPVSWTAGRAPIVTERQAMGQRSHGNWADGRGFDMSVRDCDTSFGVAA